MPYPLLLVEDGPLVLLTTQSVLEERGYEVVTATRGGSAVERLHEPISALITDIGLPDGVSGWDVARRAREVQPGIPVIYTSGGSIEDTAANAVPGGVMLQKPYRADLLLWTVAALVGSAAGDDRARASTPHAARVSGPVRGSFEMGQG